MDHSLTSWSKFIWLPYESIMIFTLATQPLDKANGLMSLPKDLIISAETLVLYAANMILLVNILPSTQQHPKFILALFMVIEHPSHGMYFGCTT